MRIRDTLYLLFVPFDEAGVHLTALTVCSVIGIAFLLIDVKLLQMFGVI